MLSKLSLLRFISLIVATEDYLSKLFESRATLEKIQLTCCRYSDATLMLPSQAKRFEMEHYASFEINALDCTQLENL
jgi:hypothetical protein